MLIFSGSTVTWCWGPWRGKTERVGASDEQWRELDSRPSGRVADAARCCLCWRWDRGRAHPRQSVLPVPLLRTGTQASVHHNMFISSGCQVNWVQRSSSIEKKRKGGGGTSIGGRKRRGQREGKRVWEEEAEKDGLEEENGIKRIQMEERKTGPQTHTHTKTQKQRSRQTKVH